MAAKRATATRSVRVSTLSHRFCLPTEPAGARVVTAQLFLGRTEEWHCILIIAEMQVPMPLVRTLTVITLSLCLLSQSLSLSTST
jgi:hypothetical protein